jgi:hypothetical protein
LFADCFAGLEVDQMRLTAIKTAHGRVGIGIVARHFLNEEALHRRSGDGTAKERHVAP